MNPQKLPPQVIGMTLVLLFLIGCSAPAATLMPPTPTPVPPTATPTTEPPTPVPPTATPTSEPPTPVPPTATPTPKPPTATPTQVYTLATSADEIIGTWYNRGSSIRFDDDGTFRQAHELDELDTDPYAVSSYQFAGMKMNIIEVSVSGVSSCGSKSGSYEIWLLETGNIKIVVSNENCNPRAGDIEGEYEPVP